MPVYIQSAEAISPQPTFAPGGFLEETLLPDTPYFTCIDPDYRQYINPASLRRMSRVIRMGLTASRVCLEKAGIDQPDAILIGSGLGCVQDTARFLNQVIENREQLLNPTAFIQSTHNTVSGQIALMLGCRNYNLTFSQRTISFETALLDAIMLLEEEGTGHILLGGVDEIVGESYDLMLRSGCISAGPLKDVQDSRSGRPVAGEGAAFFLLSDTPGEGSLARIDDLEIIHSCRDSDELKGLLESFLSRNGLSLDEIDLLVSGRNGDARFSGFHNRISSLFEGSVVTGYKHLVGEYDTASAFGTCLAARIIHENRVPPAVILNNASRDQISKGLVFNYSKNRDFTFTLVSRPQP